MLRVLVLGAAVLVFVAVVLDFLIPNGPQSLRVDDLHEVIAMDL